MDEIAPCDDQRGHFWRVVDDKTVQCSRCGECATEDDFRATELIEELKGTPQAPAGDITIIAETL